MKWILFFLFNFLLANEIFVASATGNAYAIPEIIKAYNKKYPNDKIHLILASSGKLTAQILHSANYDIFLAANMKYPLFLYKKKIALTKPKIYAEGKIVLFSRFPIRNYKEAILNATSISVANPKIAPYGKAAIEFLNNDGLYEKVKNKLIYAETVSAAFNYSLHSTDIGIIAKSLLFSPNLKNCKVNYVDLPLYYTPIAQGVVLLNKKAINFYNFLFSKKAKQIFKKYGYKVNE
jgi:molybdate transport system substrate-binding protein